MTREEAIGRAARCWCEKSTKHIVMEPALAEVFASELQSAERMAIFKAITKLDQERGKYMVTGIGGLALDKLRKELVILRDAGLSTKEAAKVPDGH